MRDGVASTSLTLVKCTGDEAWRGHRGTNSRARFIIHWRAGTSGVVFFRSDRDREKFLGLLESSGGRYEVSPVAFVLLENQFHLIAQTQR